MYLVFCQVLIDSFLQPVCEKSGPSECFIVVLGGLEDGVEGHEVARCHHVLFQLANLGLKSLDKLNFEATTRGIQYQRHYYRIF